MLYNAHYYKILVNKFYSHTESAEISSFGYKNESDLDKRKLEYREVIYSFILIIFSSVSLKHIF